MGCSIQEIATLFHYSPFYYNHTMNIITQKQVNHTIRRAKLPLNLEIMIPHDSLVRTFEEVFNKVSMEKYLVTDFKRKDRNSYDQFKLKAPSLQLKTPLNIEDQGDLALKMLKQSF